MSMLLPNSNVLGSSFEISARSLVSFAYLLKDESLVQRPRLLTSLTLRQRRSKSSHAPPCRRE
eukprot:10624056-Karenia_brevis.AAC.1